MSYILLLGLLLQGTLPTATIGWEPPIPAEPVWYNLYRTNNPNNGPCNGGTWTKVNTNRIGFFMVELQFTDTNAVRGTMYYAVTALNDENSESDCSDIVIVNIPNRKPPKPTNPKLIGITP